MKKTKISIFEYNTRHMEVRDAKKDLAAANASFAKAEQCQIMDNCKQCKGTGEVKDGHGDPAHNPTGVVLYRDCSQCEGKGYVEN